MNAPADWAGQNQRWLATRLAHWRGRIQAATAGDDAAQPAPAAGANGFQPAVLGLADAFGLSAFETELLVLAAGVEIDAALGEAVARAQGQPAGGPVRLGFALALKVLPLPHWDALSPLAPLRAWSLVEFDTAAGFAHATLRIDERILHAITGVAAFDERLAGIAQATETAQAGDDPDEATIIARALAARPDALVVLADAWLDAGAMRGARRLAGCALRRAGLRTLWVDARAVGGDVRDIAETARRIDREALLSQSGVVVSSGGTEPAHGATALRLAAALSSPTMLLGAPDPLSLADVDRPVLRFAVPRIEATLDPGLPAPVHAAARRALQQFRVDQALLEQALNRPAAPTATPPRKRCGRRCAQPHAAGSTRSRSASKAAPRSTTSSYPPLSPPSCAR